MDTLDISFDSLVNNRYNTDRKTETRQQTLFYSKCAREGEEQIRVKKDANAVGHKGKNEKIQ